MSRYQREYSIRLTAQNKQQLENDLRGLGVTGEKALRLIQKSTQPASRGLQDVSRDSRMLQEQLKGVGAQVPAVQRLARLMSTTALAGSLALFAKSSLDVAKKFEAAMKRVQAATQAPSEAIERLAQRAKQLGSTTQFTATETAGAIEVLAKNGLGVRDILEGALDATVMLAGALGGELAPSADLATDIMQQFGLKAADLPQIADRLAGAALSSKFGFEDLAGAIGQAGGVAGKFGVDIDEFLTALAATASGFSGGSDAGTSFKTFLQRLTPDSRVAKDAIAELGLEFFDASGNMRSMQEIAGQLQDSVAGLSEEARNTNLRRIFGADAIRTALLLADLGSEGFADVRLRVEGVSAVEQAQTRMEGFEGALKEVVSAWEGLQLASAEAGGLDVAEKAADRLAAALRYVTENFEYFEDVVERVARLLAVQLVGRGLRAAFALMVARRAAAIELAGAITGVGTAASNTAGSLGRMARAGRALTAIAGGPAGLAITAASLVALFVNTDRAADALEASQLASEKAGSALEAYTEATKRAREEQSEFGGVISDTTKEMVDQSVAALNQALVAARAAFPKLEDEAANMLLDFSEGFNRINALNTRRTAAVRILSPDDDINEIIRDFSALAESVAGGTRSFEEFLELYDALQKIPDRVGDDLIVFQHLIETGQEGGDLFKNLEEIIVNVASSTGMFGDELRALDSAQNEDDRRAAWLALARALVEGFEAVERLRKGFGEAEIEIVEAARVGQARIEELEKAISSAFGATDGVGSEPFKAIKDGAVDASESVEQLIERIGQAYKGYEQFTNFDRASTDRGAWSRSAEAAANKGILDLIGYAEGTDRGRGYNETLDYGRWTGGNVNLVNMTLREILALQSRMLDHPENRAMYGDASGARGSSALGRYQIVSSTLRGLIDQLGLSMDEQFTPGLQDRLALELIRQQGSSPAGLQGTWVGLQNVPRQTITAALGGQAIPGTDPEVAKRQKEAADAAADAAEERTRELQSQADAIEKLVATGDQYAEQLQHEKELLGSNTRETEYLRFVHERLAEAKAAGINVDTAVTASGETVREVIERQAKAAAKYADELERAGRAAGIIPEEVQSARGQLDTLFNGLINGSLSGREAVAGLFDYLRQRILQAVFDPFLEYLSQLIGSLLGNLFTSGPAGLFSGGGLLGRAHGGPIEIGGRQLGLIKGGSGGPTEDNIILRGSRGEYMHRAAAVNYYGVDFMEKINSLQFPRFASGGLIGGGGAGDPVSPGGVGMGSLFGDISISTNVDATGQQDGQLFGAELASALAAELPREIEAKLVHHMRGGGLLWNFVRGNK